MNDNQNGAGVVINIDELFNDSTSGTPPLNEQDKASMTAAMTKRINEVREKAEKEVRAKVEQEMQEKMAKELGFATYEEMQKASETNLIKGAGLNPDDVEKIIEPIIAKRLAADPRLQELQTLKAKEQDNYITNELAKLEQMTGIKLTRENISKEALDLWQNKGVDLSRAIIASNPTDMLIASKGSTNHLAPNPSKSPGKMRALTPEERSMYKYFNPDLTETELNQKTVEVKE